MSKMYTTDDIRALGPCFDPVTGQNEDGDVIRTSGLLHEEWTGSLFDILNVEDCRAEDRLWVVFGLVDAKSQRLLACRFVRRTPLVDGRTVWDLLTDARSRSAIETSERFASDEATSEELSTALDAATRAAWKDRDPARSTAKDAAGDAAGATAIATAPWAAWDAARDAARDAVRAAALDGATWTAAKAAQIEIVRQFLAEGEDDEQG